MARLLTTAKMCKRCTLSLTDSKAVHRQKEKTVGGLLGVWKFDAEVEPSYLERAKCLLFSGEPDRNSLIFQHNFGAINLILHTKRECCRDAQPQVTPTGQVVAWLGRLDNRDELVKAASDLTSEDNTDASVAASAVERWGIGSFARFRGDWTLSVWNPHERTLMLANDYMGIRRVYYQLTTQTIVWSTRLRPIVLLSRDPLRVNTEYIAGYLALHPSAHLTPYQGIHAVPPGCSVTLKNGDSTVRRYWSVTSGQELQYRSDAEYEDHFRHLFRQSVRRRLHSHSPIAAELSGGLDSSSIVCMADDILSKGESRIGPVHTISYYDPASPAGDERPYIKLVETKRGKTGHHLQTSRSCPFFSFGKDFVVVPGASPSAAGLRKTVLDLMQREGYRVVLSGLGGDEFLGGVPNSAPQLADLIVRWRPIELIRQLAAWSVTKRTPWVHLLFKALSLLPPPYLRGRLGGDAELAPWIDPIFARKYDIAIRQLGPQGNYGFWLPTKRDSAQTLIAMRRQLAYTGANCAEVEERRYPYLDQDLVEFLLSIPANQLLRPGQRRSLMRRALVDLVPPEILSRRTKGGAAGGALFALDANWAELDQLFVSPLSAGIGCIDGYRFQESLRAARSGDAQHLVCLMKTVYLELWLRGLARHQSCLVPSQTSQADSGLRPLPARPSTIASANTQVSTGGST